MGSGDASGSARCLKSATLAFNKGDSGWGTMLAQYYDQGQGVPQDPALATQWYAKAAKTDPDAEATYGERLAMGTGIAPDPARGLALMIKAAREGDTSAPEILADWYTHSPHRDALKVFEWGLVSGLKLPRSLSAGLTAGQIKQAQSWAIKFKKARLVARKAF